MTFVRVDGLTLHYLREGKQGGTPLVFINSLGTDLRLWDDVVEGFAGRYAILRYDKRGHGLSDCPPAPYTIQDHTDDLAGLLSHLGIEDALVVGISVGGMIALDFVARYPGRVRALVLCDTAAKIGTPEAWAERAAAVRATGMESMSEAILARWFAPDFAERRPAEYRGFANMLARTPVEGYAGTCEAIRDADLTQAASTIKVKSLGLCGAEDAATLPHVVREMTETLMDCQFELIEGAGHLPCVEEPDALVKKVNQFLVDNGYV